MNILLGNIGTIFSNIITWLGQISINLLTNPIFIFLIAVIIFTKLYNTIRLMIQDKKVMKKYYNGNATIIPARDSNGEYYEIVR